MNSSESIPKTRGFCRYPFEKLKILPNGDAQHCAWMKPRTLGNVLRTPLDRIWNGSAAGKIRQAIEQGELARPCRSGHCPWLFKERVAVEIAKRDLPSIIELDLPNTHCNIGGEDPVATRGACIMCPRSALKFRPDVDYCDEIARSLRPWISHFRQLHIQGIAEPFWKGRIFSLLDVLGVRYHENLKASTITNGTVFSQRVRDQWREMCPQSLTLVSIDAASSQVYRAIRRIDGLERVVENLKAFCREKGPGQICAIANNINTLNVGEVEQMVEMAANAGCDYISLNATDEVDRSMAHFTVNTSNWQRFAEAEERARAAAERLGIPLYFVKPLHKNLAGQGASRE